MKTQIVIQILFSVLFATAAFGQSTPDYYRCFNPLGGEWNYGRVPQVCDANAFGEDRIVLGDYPKLIFLDAENRTSERPRYVTEMAALIREAATYYLNKRKPSASAEEISHWTYLVHVTAAQESRMSHYRHASDARLKMVRGDVGHGHGMMQIDDRSHFNPIVNGLAWNLITNLTYGMDILFAQWERAPSQSCVGSATNWKARSRSAWAAYNGGPGSICRWTNPNSVWAGNDRGFLTMYDSQTWKPYVTNDRAPASVDVPCLVENHRNCLPPGDGSNPALIAGRIYKLNDGRSCAFLGGHLQCVEMTRDTLCLKAMGNVDLSRTYPLASVPAGIGVTNQDRHGLCSQYDSRLLAVGSHLQTVIAINLRSTPGGGLLTAVPQGEVVQITDFELRNSPTNDRYYQVQYKTQKGYLYAGTFATQSSWVVAGTPRQNFSSVAQTNEVIQIATPSGINMRATPGGSLIVAIPNGTRLTILEAVVQGANNEVYYRVRYNSRIGYIYSGTLLPQDTTSLWTKRL